MKHSIVVTRAWPSNRGRRGDVSRMSTVRHIGARKKVADRARAFENVGLYFGSD